MVERIKANGRSLLRPSVSGVEYLRKKDMMLRCQMQGDPVTNLKTLLYNVQVGSYPIKS